MKIIKCQTVEEIGQRAATLAADALNRAIAEKGSARIVLSTGASQFTTLAALVTKEVDWSKVEMFHLDEYIGIDRMHPASFIRYLQERFVDKLPVGLKAVNFVDPSVGVETAMSGLQKKLDEADVDVGMIGIGENAHIAFNDPPADFEIRTAYKVVNLDEKCRKQQLGEGWFRTMEEVPRQAISMTVTQILKCKKIISAVPHSAKAEAIRSMLTAPEITPQVPATILKSHPEFTLLVDSGSASLVEI